MDQINSSKEITIVVGLGRSGLAAAKLLHAQGAKVVVIEEANTSYFEKLSKELLALGIVVKLGISLELESFMPWLSQLKSVLISPAIPWDHYTINQLRERGIKIESEISLAWKSMKHIPWIGITGTNGKTTVTQMLNHVLKQNEIDSEMAGNIGIPVAQLALNHLKDAKKDPQFLVVELSSYQLETTHEIAPLIGIWTTLTPDHLERHESLKKYSDIKKRLLDNAHKAIYNLDDEFLLKNKATLRSGVWISANGSGTKENQADYWIHKNGKIYEHTKELLDSSVLKIRGVHNLQNLLLVIAAAREIGLSPNEIQKGIASFQGVEHRLEKIGSLHGIEIFNDSKATNYESAKMGLAAMQPPTIVIAGGQSKKGDSHGWIQELKKKASAIMLFGESAKQIEGLIKTSNFLGKVSCFKDLEEAAEASFELAIERKVNSILFSPACASFDQYKNYEERGDHFKKLTRQWLSILMN
ncbi:MULTISPECIES: UDP-N-acetylmuramoyl-L-alanine--D-glutamate ligase [Prochlorococcus]|uniref:UDP-N-acetylmuramoyl-L-alanine--D-glutamate ligase n=1 Tax=Prochlorococcus TaxID=1218 RepID=UPI000533761E|nr:MULTISPECIES: UDP-N-acetylmuramoyl-L-alanine--D-glutamate ligase [Prochlorococcus]KGG11916.1 UDP-N-acetylmuramoylalanine--D-glutamate ligase [Prochlorococcus sp. MIT 0601]